MSDDAQTVAILDAHGKMMEWNGEDYVEQGSVAAAPPLKDSKDDERDSDQYLVMIFPA